jgi:hypothetical protein
MKILAFQHQEKNTDVIRDHHLPDAALPSRTIASSLIQSARYDDMIANVSKTNRLNQIVKSDVSNEIWDIVAATRGSTTAGNTKSSPRSRGSQDVLVRRRT